MRIGRVGAVAVVVMLCVGGGVAQGEPYDPWTQAARYRVELVIDLDAAGLGGREAIRLWVAAPAESLAAQRVQKREVHAPWPHRWGRGDASWACRSRYGNCTDFHSVWIGLLRAGGVPARFRIGFPIPPNQAAGALAGYHCWAEFLEPDRGWVPVDVSEAKKTQAGQAFFGALPSDRVAFTTGRDLLLSPPPAGGRAVERVPATLRFERLAP